MPVSSRPRYLPLKFVAAGVLSGLLCWLGGLVAPENSLLIKIYPGVIFGSVLYALGRHAAFAPPRRHGVTYAIMVLSSVASWRAAVDIGYMHGRPWPMLAAGALGALVLCLGLMWAWGWRRQMALAMCAIVATGALVAQAVQWMWDAWPHMDEALEASLLFIVWQALVMLSIALGVPPALRASP
jgi:hypothetical protein